MPIDLLPNRRRFLTGLAVTGAALVARPTAKAEPIPRPRAGWMALVSDVHLAADPKARLLGHCMGDNYRAVVDDILARRDAPRGVLINGDLALTSGQPGDYRTFLDLS